MSKIPNSRFEVDRAAARAFSTALLLRLLMFHGKHPPDESAAAAVADLRDYLLAFQKGHHGHEDLH